MTQIKLKLTTLLLLSVTCFQVCSASNILMKDITGPTAVCQGSVFIALDDSGTATIGPEAIDAGSSDPDGPVTLSIDRNFFTCADIGTTITVWLTVTDTDGNTNNCFSEIEVQDKMGPTAICQASINASLNDSGELLLTPDQVDAGSYDNCNLYFELSRNLYTCDDIGTYLESMTVTDAGGNTNVCVYSVTIEDKVSPNLLCIGEVFLNLPVEGSITLSPEDFILSVSDNCEISSSSLSQSVFSCFDGGSTIVTVTTTDNSGNSAVCTSVVTIIDSDCDGVADTCDRCDGADDSIDHNLDGIPDCSQALNHSEYLPSWVCGDRPGRERVLICRNGNTRCVRARRLSRILRRGHAVGPCASCSSSDFTLQNKEHVASAEHFSTFTLFPSPSNGVFTIQSDSELPLDEVVIHNLTGQEISRYSGIKENQVRINLLDKNLETGIYYITIKQGQHKSGIKFILNP